MHTGSNSNCGIRVIIDHLRLDNILWLKSSAHQNGDGDDDADSVIGFGTTVCLAHGVKVAEPETCFFFYRKHTWEQLNVLYNIVNRLYNGYILHSWNQSNNFVVDQKWNGTFRRNGTDACLALYRLMTCFWCAVTFAPIPGSALLPPTVPSPIDLLSRCPSISCPLLLFPCTDIYYRFQHPLSYIILLSLLRTRTYRLSLFSGLYSRFPLLSFWVSSFSFLVLSCFVTPHIRPSILISATVYFLSRASFAAHVSTTACNLSLALYIQFLSHRHSLPVLPLAVLHSKIECLLHTTEYPSSANVDPRYLKVSILFTVSPCSRIYSWTSGIPYSSYQTLVIDLLLSFSIPQVSFPPLLFCTHWCKHLHSITCKLFTLIKWGERHLSSATIPMVTRKRVQITLIVPIERSCDR